MKYTYLTHIADLIDMFVQKVTCLALTFIIINGDIVDWDINDGDTCYFLDGHVYQVWGWDIVSPNMVSQTYFLSCKNVCPTVCEDYYFFVKLVGPIFL